MAKYMLFFVGTEDAWEADLAQEEVTKASAPITAWWEELQRRGIGRTGRELGHTRTAVTVRRTNGRMRVTDGPFVEAKEHVGGYAVIEASDLDDAIAVAKSWPPREFLIEVRPVVER